MLEIGSASGITMYKIAPYVGLYYGTDLSEKMIAKNRQRVLKQKIGNIKLKCLPAHEIDQLEERNFDIIIINSVIQYFPGYNYLRNVVSKAIGLLSSKGILLIGDIRDEDLKQEYVQSLLDFRRNNPESAKLKINITDELFLSRKFFPGFTSGFPGNQRDSFFDEDPYNF